MRKSSVKRLEAAGRRKLRERERARKLWQKRLDRLNQLIEVFKTNPTMQPQTWIDGQVRHYTLLRDNHLKTKPR